MHLALRSFLPASFFCCLLTVAPHSGPRLLRGGGSARERASSRNSDCTYFALTAWSWRLYFRRLLGRVIAMRDKNSRSGGKRPIRNLWVTAERSSNTEQSGSLRPCQRTVKVHTFLP